MSEAFIHTEKLSYSYRDSDGKNEHPALRGISVDIQKGEYVAVLGHNGSGKSTFAKLLNLLLEPTGGRLVIGGVELTGKLEILLLSLPLINEILGVARELFALGGG